MSSKRTVFTDYSKRADALRTKVGAIFKKLPGQPAELPSKGMPLIQSILPVLLPNFDSETAHDIGLHLSDWIEDAAFLVALHLFPSRFTRDEIELGVHAFMAHAPNHVAAAAALFGSPIEDIFEVGALDGPDKNDSNT